MMNWFGKKQVNRVPVLRLATSSDEIAVLISVRDIHYIELRDTGLTRIFHGPDLTEMWCDLQDSVNHLYYAMQATSYLKLALVPVET